MPLRAYEPLSPPCRLCGAGFDRVQAAGEPILSECPRCGQPVKPRAASTVNSPTVTRPTATTEAKAAGFTVLKRIGKGEYEKQ